MSIERTLSIVKPDAVAKNVIGEIYKRFEDGGLRIVASRMLQLDRAKAEGFYAVHKERPFFGELVEYMTSGPILAMVLEGDSAIQKWRDLMGPTDATKAGPETIRGRFGTTIQNNAAHGSDATETAAFEMGFMLFVPREDLIFLDMSVEDLRKRRADEVSSTLLYLDRGNDDDDNSLIELNTEIDLPREPDAVAWITDYMFATADEGDLEGYQTMAGTALTDADGAYTIHFLVPGSYDVTVEAPVVMPGLWDCHTHFVGMSLSSLDALATIDLVGSAARAVEDAGKVLDGGITSVRDVGGIGLDRPHRLAERPPAGAHEDRAEQPPTYLASFEEGRHQE